jgi:hypothetical protein
VSATRSRDLPVDLLGIRCLAELRAQLRLEAVLDVRERIETSRCAGSRFRALFGCFGCSESASRRRLEADRIRKRIETADEQSRVFHSVQLTERCGRDQFLRG